jgi:hypothetical protein
MDRILSSLWPKIWLFVVVAVIAFVFESARGALRPFAYRGTVIAKDSQSETIEIATEFAWESSGWESHQQALTGIAPNEDALAGIDVGDYVAGVSLGVAGESWITLGKLMSAADPIITDIYGSPGHLFDLPLMGDYDIAYSNAPDCGACEGCNCEAEYATVTITDRGMDPAIHELSPGETHLYQNSHGELSITFLSGKAPAYPECTATPCLGPQPLSNFVIHISNEFETTNAEDEDGNGSGSCFLFTAMGVKGRNK